VRAAVGEPTRSASRRRRLHRSCRRSRRRDVSRHQRGTRDLRCAVPTPGLHTRTSTVCRSAHLMTMLQRAVARHIARQSQPTTRKMKFSRIRELQALTNVTSSVDMQHFGRAFCPDRDSTSEARSAVLARASLVLRVSSARARRSRRYSERMTSRGRRPSGCGSSCPPGPLTISTISPMRWPPPTR